MIRCIIIEDNDFHRDKLLKLLAEYEDVEVLGHFPNAETGRKAIADLHPDLVFLDIEMPPGRNGLEMLAEIPEKERTFDTIFVTEFNDYAVRAIELSCLAYLEKSVAPEKLTAALERHRAETDRNQQIQKYGVLIEFLQDMPIGRQPINLPLGSGNGFKRVRIEEIVFLSAADSYTTFHFTDGSERKVSHRLNQWDRSLSEYGVIRIHKSFSVNLKHVVEYNPSDGMLKVQYGLNLKSLPVGDTYRSGFEGHFYV
ncbi:MAG: response regulator transcription factor [Flavobacteriales bacterium]|nr:response regulator transcription factor [Flavobacteriales bacterium]